MVHKSLPKDMHLFDFETPIALSKGGNPPQEMEVQRKFWEELAS
jgi:hypothetical protein